MANPLLYVKLDKNQRKLYKAGMVDDNGNLTSDGKAVALNLLLEDKTFMAKFIALVDEMNLEDNTTN